MNCGDSGQPSQERTQDGQKASLTGIEKRKSSSLRAKAKKEAEEVVQIMSEKFNIEDDYAQGSTDDSR